MITFRKSELTGGGVVGMDFFLQYFSNFFVNFQEEIFKCIVLHISF